MKLNLENFEKVKAAIMAEPENLYMGQWHCGTAHFIAGWAQALAKRPFDAAWTAACEYLGIDASRFADDLDEDYFDGLLVPLFRVSAWPGDLRRRYHKARTAKGRAKIACLAIDWFIAKHGEAA